MSGNRGSSGTKSGRSVASWASALLSAVILAACSGQPAATEKSPASSASPSASEPQTLTIWTFKPNHIPALQAVADAWNKKTGKNVTVDAKYFTESDGVYQSKMTAAAHTGDLPDMLAYYGGAHWVLAGQGIYTDMTAKVDAQWQSAFNPAVAEESIKFSPDVAAACAKNPDCKYQNLKVGSIYALPQIEGATGYIFAYKDRLKAAGLDPNTPPKTWEEWVGMMKATVAKDSKQGGLLVGLKVPETGYLWLYKLLAFSHLGPDAFAQRYEPGGQWTAPKSLETFQLYDQLSPLWIPGAMQYGIAEAESRFAHGDATWLLGGTFSYSAIVQEGAKPENLLIFPVPTSANGAVKQRLFKPWVSVMLGITKDSKHPDLALDFMKFLFSPEGGAIFGRVAHDLPAVNVGHAAGIDPFLITAQQSFANSKDAFNEMTPYGPQCDAAKTVNNQASVALTKLITKELDATGVAKEYQQIFSTAWQGCK